MHKGLDGATVRPQAPCAYLLRRVTPAGRRGAPRHVGYADTRRTQATDPARRKRQGGGTLTMLALLLEGTLKGSLILALAALLTGSMRGRSAAARHLVWSIALLAMAALPLATRLTPAWNVTVPAAVASRVTLARAVVSPVSSPSETIPPALIPSGERGPRSGGLAFPPPPPPA